MEKIEFYSDVLLKKQIEACQKKLDKSPSDPALLARMEALKDEAKRRAER